MDVLRFLLPFLKPYRWRLLLGTLGALAGTAAATSIPRVLGSAVDELNTRGIVADNLLRVGGLLLLLAFIDGMFRFVQRVMLLGTAHLIENDLRGTMFRRLLSLDQGFYGAMHTGDLMTRVTNDLSAVRQLLGPGLNSLVGAGLLIIAAATMMLISNLQLGLMVLVMLPIVTILFVVVGGRMRRIFRRVQDQFGQISTRAQENFSGIRTIKAYAQEDAEIEVFRIENEKYRTLNVRYVMLSGLLWPAIGLVLGTIGAVVLLVGGRQVASGTMTLGDLVLFNAYLAQLGWPVISLGWSVDLYQQASSSITRITEVLHRRPSISTAASPTPGFAPQGAVEFRDVGVRFNYEQAHKDSNRSAVLAAHPTHGAGDGWMLRHISFSVPAGGSLAIVGATGAGKTTLVNLLARVRDPDEGEVRLDGADIRMVPLDELRAAIGYVPQDTFLFSVPLRENVTFGRPDASEDEIQNALVTSRLSNDLVQFPAGIDTMIGERGVTLSGGQKQRTAIARAVLRAPQILVLDDALSSVDTHTAAEILAGLRQVMQGRTSILIAQRIATVKDADQILVLHDGTIAERGSHRELLELGGRYAAMYRRELLQAELEDE
ncbi:MAG TPA: ABC transporter ATP-binding protein [Roseiflexaceae bacterium]|nr:ABC transporter ATP-binding protein [Roseiflexaceae bacterium]